MSPAGGVKYLAPSRTKSLGASSKASGYTGSSLVLGEICWAKVLGGSYVHSHAGHSHPRAQGLGWALPAEHRTNPRPYCTQGRGSNVSLMLDMSSLGSVEPIQRVCTPRDITLRFLRMSSHILPKEELPHQAKNLTQLQEEFSVRHPLGPYLIPLASPPNLLPSLPSPCSHRPMHNFGCTATGMRVGLGDPVVGVRIEPSGPLLQPG
uniref:protein-tyrosine-phosphatase n=1 Tax=Crocodylus porosus TaxID=8502 RepID=A0A7M4EGD8_CROPO